jgi:hypothetical protein
MRAAIPNQVSLHGASLSPGEVAERHRKKVSSQAGVREHTARRSCGHLGVFIHVKSPKHKTLKLLTLGLFSSEKDPNEGAGVDGVRRFSLRKLPSSFPHQRVSPR